MKWELKQLGDLVETLKGFAFKSEWFQKSGIPIVKVKDFTENSISENDLDYISSEKASELQKYALTSDDVIIQTVGSWASNPNSVVGKVICTPKNLDGALLNQNAVKLISAERLNKRFLFYCLRSDDFKGYIIGTAQGAANQASITLDAIRKYTFQLPPLPTQQKIASILSAYDDLIENNLKRIRLLEEAAQHLYREWFVKFRFPGWEKAEVVVGLPEGWEKKKLGEVAIIEWGDTSVTKAKYVEKGYNAYSASGCDGKLSYFDFDRTGIVLSAIGAYAGLTWFALGKWSAIKNTLKFWSKDEKMTDEYLFLATYGMNYWMRRGSAQPFIALGDARNQVLIAPTQNVVAAFSQKIRPFFLQIDLLKIQNQKLKEARDILLPRLMNQTIEV